MFEVLIVLLLVSVVFSLVFPLLPFSLKKSLKKYSPLITFVISAGLIILFLQRLM